MDSVNVTVSPNEMMQTDYDLPESELEMPNRTQEGRFRYFLSIVLLASFYYTIPIIKTPFGYMTYIRLDHIASLFFVVFSFGAICKRYNRLPENKFVYIIIIATLLVLPSVILAYLRTYFLRGLQMGLLQGANYIRIFLVFLAVVTLPLDAKRFRRIMTIIWAGSVIVGVYGVFQYFGFISIRALQEQFTESGPWGEHLVYRRIALGPLAHNHAALGAYMVVAIFVGFFLSRTGFVGARIIYFASIPFFMLVILWSRSRADFFGIFVGMVVYMILLKIRPTSIAGFISIVAAIWILLAVSPELRERFLGEEQKTFVEYSSGRLTGWSENIAYLFQNPTALITGVGLGNYFTFLFSRTGLIAAHNNYLHWLTECGFLGLILPLIVLARIRKILKQLSGYDKFHNAVSTTFLALFWALLTVTMTQELFVPNPSLGAVPTYLAFVFGCIIALYRNDILENVYYENEDIEPLDIEEGYFA